MNAPTWNHSSTSTDRPLRTGAFEKVIAPTEWDGLESRVERNVMAILEMFGRAGVTGTFFTLGWIAARHPALVRRIAEAGHEVASHGWAHDRVFTLDAQRFAADLARARDALEQASGQSVTGYRAPSFSIDARTPWAHRVLAEAGYAYSSSVAPIVHDHYGWREAPRFAFRPVEGQAILEIPVTTAKVAGRRMAAGGGGFFRLFPYVVSRWAIRQVNASGHPAAFYFHPWEIDPDQPRRADAPLRSRLRHYTNLSVMAGKLERLVRDFAWDCMDAVATREAARLDAVAPAPARIAA